jgi:hypothetical protein
MAIKAPAWCENAVPTALGWEDPQTGEVYKSGGFTPEQIAEFHGETAPQKAPEVLVEVPVNDFTKTPTMLTEAPVGGKSLEEMTKIELEALGRTHGIELDRRKSKTDLIDEVKEVL